MLAIWGTEADSGTSPYQEGRAVPVEVDVAEAFTQAGKGVDVLGVVDSQGVRPSRVQKEEVRFGLAPRVVGDLLA